MHKLFNQSTLIRENSCMNLKICYTRTYLAFHFIFPQTFEVSWHYPEPRQQRRQLRAEARRTRESTACPDYTQSDPPGLGVSGGVEP